MIFSPRACQRCQCLWGFAEWPDEALVCREASPCTTCIPVAYHFAHKLASLAVAAQLSVHSCRAQGPPGGSVAVARHTVRGTLTNHNNALT
jgi:hypothetical protein